MTSQEKLSDDLLREVYRQQMERDSGSSKCCNKKGKDVNLDKLSNREKAEVINALRNKYQLKGLLAALKIEKSSYCYQNRGLHSKDKYNNLRENVKQDFVTAYKSYEFRCIHRALKDRGVTASEKIILREQLQIKAIRRKNTVLMRMRFRRPFQIW